MDLSPAQHDEILEVQRRRESLSPDIPGELRLNSRGEILLAHSSALLDRIVRIVVDPRPARRRDDEGERLGLRAVLDDGRQLWLGEACGLFATSLSIAARICCCRLDALGGIGVRRVPLESTFATGVDPQVAEPGTMADVVRQFSVGASSVAATAQPGNPEPDVPLLHRLRRLARGAGAAAA